MCLLLYYFCCAKIKGFAANFADRASILVQMGDVKVACRRIFETAARPCG